MQQHRIIAFFIPVIAILITGKIALAEDPSPVPVFSLQECIEIALGNNPNILSSRAQLQQARYQKKSAASNFYPDLNLDYSYTYQDKVASFSSPGGEEISVGQHDNWAMSIYVEQPIFTGFEILSNYNLAKIGLKTAIAETQVTRLEIIFQTTRAYYEILKAEKYQEVTEDAVIYLKSHLANSQKFYDAGIIPLNDLLEAKVNLANARQEARTAKSNVRLARNQLAKLMDRPLGFKFIVKDIARESRFETGLESLLEKAYAKRPALKKANYNLASSRQRINLAKSDYYPTLNLRASHNRYGTDPLVNGQGISDFSQPEENIVSVAAVWNLWSGMETAAEVNRAEAGLKEAGYMLREIKNEVSLEVRNNFEQAQTAYNNIRPARLAVKQAEEHLRMISKRYQQQLSTNTEVLDARRLLTETEFNYYQALYDYNILLASLARSTACPLSEF